MNKVFLIGNTCKDNDIKSSNGGTLYLRNTIAVKRSTKDANGNYISDFIDFVAFNNQANYINQYCPKGSKIAIEGSWQVRTYQANDGTNRTAHELIVNSVELLKSSQDAQPKPQQQPQPQYPSYSNNPFDDTLDDPKLPF